MFEALENRRTEIPPQDVKTAVHIAGKPFDFSNPNSAGNFDRWVQFQDGKLNKHMAMKVSSPQARDPPGRPEVRDPPDRPDEERVKRSRSC